MSERCVYIDCERSKETVIPLKGILKTPRTGTKRPLHKSKSRKVHFGTSRYRVIPNREMLTREQHEHEEAMRKQQTHNENDAMKTQTLSIDTPRRSTIIEQKHTQYIPNSRVQYSPYNRIQYNSPSRVQCNPPMFYRSQRSIRSWPKRHSLLGKPPLLTQVLYPYVD